MIQKVLHFQFLENFVYEYLLALLIIVCGVLLVNWLLDFFLKRLSKWYKKIIVSRQQAPEICQKKSPPFS
jgi:uncharacterized membrane protein